MKIQATLVSVIVLSSYPASAHDAKGPNGGRMTDAGSYHIELVTKSDVVDVFISDTNEKPLSSSGFKGTAILVADGKSQRIVLEAADASRLTGKASSLPDQPKGVVQLTAPDGKTALGKFN